MCKQCVNSNKQCVNSDFCLLYSKSMWNYCSRAGKKKKKKTKNKKQNVKPENATIDESKKPTLVKSHISIGISGFSK